jgi:Cu(I)/Ag(I) efflux system periplasmic protein CusF
MKHAPFSIASTLCVLMATTPALAAPYMTAPQPPAGTALYLVHEGHAGAAQGSGVVNSVDAAQRKVNLSHGSIKQLGWPAMTMDFPVSTDVDISTLKPGMEINFTLVRGNGGAWTVDTAKASKQK